MKERPNRETRLAQIRLRLAQAREGLERAGSRRPSAADRRARIRQRLDEARAGLGPRPTEGDTPDAGTSRASNLRRRIARRVRQRLAGVKAEISSSRPTSTPPAAPSGPAPSAEAGDSQSSETARRLAQAEYERAQRERAERERASAEKAESEGRATGFPGLEYEPETGPEPDDGGQDEPPSPPDPALDPGWEPGNTMWGLPVTRHGDGGFTVGNEGLSGDTRSFFAGRYSPNAPEAVRQIVMEDMAGLTRDGFLKAVFTPMEPGRGDWWVFFAKDTQG